MKNCFTERTSPGFQWMAFCKQLFLRWNYLTYWNGHIFQPPDFILFWGKVSLLFFAVIEENTADIPFSCSKIFLIEIGLNMPVNLHHLFFRALYGVSLFVERIQIFVHDPQSCKWFHPWLLPQHHLYHSPVASMGLVILFITFNKCVINSRSH